jgi:Leucine-rich repeat (LRR) protein
MLNNLRSLKIEICDLLTVLPDEIGQLSRLQTLMLFYLRLKRLPSTMGELQHLSELFIHNCCRLRSLPPSILDLTELQSLGFRDFPEKQICDFFVPGCNNLQKSLESVVMHNCNLGEGEGLSKVWSFLLHCPKLERIDLAGNHIANLKAFLLTSPSGGTDEDKCSGKPSRLRSLRLQDNPIDEDPEDLKALLNTHLQLEYYCSHSSFTPEVQYLLDINKCGRILLEGGVRPSPLSVWSKVLERTSSFLDGDIERTAAVFFYFLRNGPAFANRNEPWK